MRRRALSLRSSQLAARGRHQRCAAALHQRVGRRHSADVITRFAPAPTGFLHLGHVLNALWVWKTARASGDGRVLLRIEDHDRQRSRPEFDAAILEDLTWLGFVADGPVVRQSERAAIYEDALATLLSLIHI